MTVRVLWITPRHTAHVSSWFKVRIIKVVVLSSVTLASGARFCS